MKFKYKLPIGDVSGDGHDKHETFLISANKDVDDALKAYRKACKKFPSSIHPDKILNDYEENTLQAEVDKQIRDAGFNLFPPIEEDEDYPESISTENFVDYVVWFMNQGDSDLKAKVIVDKMKTLHLGSMGYGLFY